MPQAVGSIGRHLQIEPHVAVDFGNGDPIGDHERDAFDSERQRLQRQLYTTPSGALAQVGE